MAVPILAGVLGVAGKLFGNVFGPAGKARRAARRAKRKAKGKKGIFGGFFKNIFGKKRSKGQRVVDRANGLLEKQAQKDQKLRDALEAQQKKSGFHTLQEFLDSKGSVSKPLPFGLSTLADKIGIRQPQQFQLDPVVQAMIAKGQVGDFGGARVEPTGTPKNKGQVLDMKTIAIIGAGAIALILFMKK